MYLWSQDSAGRAQRLKKKKPKENIMTRKQAGKMSGIGIEDLLG